MIYQQMIIILDIEAIGEKVLLDNHIQEIQLQLNTCNISDLD